jgi:hypothetical protein
MFENWFGSTFRMNAPTVMTLPMAAAAAMKMLKDLMDRDDT